VALNLRRAILRRAIITTAVIFVLSLVISFASGGPDVAPANLGWPIAMSLGIGIFSALQMIWKIKKSVLDGIPSCIAMRRVNRADYPDANWQSIDDYGVQLQSRGYSFMGDFAIHPSPPQFKAVASCFLDSSSRAMVEVQHIMSAQRLDLQPADTTQVHFSIFSFLAGNIAVTDTGRTPNAVNYLLANNIVMGECHPGAGLMDLLEKHARRLAKIQQNTGQTVANDLTMERYVLQQRERFDAVRTKISAMNGYQIASEMDEFDASPKLEISLPDATLRALVPRSLASLEMRPDARSVPPIVDAQSSPASSNEAAAAVAGVEQTAEMQSLRPQIDSGASWFYWIAGLSLVNAISAAFGSNWGFVIGLGFSQILSGLSGAGDSAGDGGAGLSVSLRVIFWGLNLAFIAGIAYIGWQARRPSTVLFVIGFAIFALDTLLFVFAQDWVGIGFHALALYFIWKGFSAARQYNALARR
jgi:hypothetical protein